jgi:hypothetical protein
VDRIDSAGKIVSQHLEEALGSLRHSMEQVELWATAVLAFAQPIPELTPRNDNLLPRENEGAATAEPAESAVLDGSEPPPMRTAG